MRIFLRILLVLLIMILAVIPLLEGFLFFFGDDLKGYAENKIRENFAARIRVGKFEYSVLSKFPDITLKLSDIELNDYSRITEDQLFEADQLLLVFNIWDVLTKNYKIKEMQLTNARLNLFVDERNNDNYHIFKENTDGKADTTSLTFDLKRIRFDNLIFNYVNELKEQDISLDFREAEAKGSFSEETFTTRVKGDIHARRFMIGDVNYIDNKTVILDAGLSANMRDNHFTIQESSIKVSDILLVGSGTFSLKDDRTDMDLQLKGKDLSIKSFISLLPDSLRQDFEKLNSSGEFYFNTGLKGSLSKYSDPGVRVNFGVKDVTIKNAQMPVPLEHVSLQGLFINEKAGDSTIYSIAVSNITASISGRKLTGAFKLTGEESPYLTANLETNLSLQEVQKFMKPDEIESMSGDVGLDVEFAGLLDDLRSASTVANTHSQGTISLQNLAVKLRDADPRLTAVNGLFKFNLNDLEIDTLSGMLAGSDFIIQGSLKNFLPYILLERQKMTVTGSLSSKNMDLDKLVMPVSSPDSTPGESLQNIKLDLKLDVKALKFKRFSATDLSGSIAYAEEKLSTDNLKFSSMNGKLDIKGSIYGLGNNVATIANIQCSNINLKELFKQCDNFGQDEITDRNLRGMLTANIVFSGLWTNRLDPVMDKMEATADLKVVNGEILDYEPLQKLSGFIDISELRHLRFSNMENRIEVKNKMITIPLMDISSNVLNLTMAGTHSFDNYMDYRMKIKLADILAKKFRLRKQEQPEDDMFFEETPKGTFLYLRMEGTPDKLKFKYDQENVGKKIGSDFKKEGALLKQLIKDEIKPKPKPWEKPKEKPKPPPPKDDGVNFEDDLPQ
jgi:uncharacterized protein involved in outer membrane biogenesis